jgi:excisionase family DNA binding protein
MVEQEEQLVISVGKTAHLLDMGEQQIRKMIKRGELRAVKIGHDWRISRRSIDDLLAPLQGEQEAK